jgi:hypothetical protein
MKDKLEKLPIYSTIKPSVHFRMDKKELTDPQSILTKHKLCFKNQNSSSKNKPFQGQKTSSEKQPYQFTVL